MAARTGLMCRLPAWHAGAGRRGQIRQACEKLVSAATQEADIERVGPPMFRVSGDRQFKTVLPFPPYDQTGTSPAAGVS